MQRNIRSGIRPKRARVASVSIIRYSDLRNSRLPLSQYATSRWCPSFTWKRPNSSTQMSIRGKQFSVLMVSIIWCSWSTFLSFRYETYNSLICISMPPVSFRRGPSTNAKFELNLNHLSFVVENVHGIALLTRTTIAGPNGSQKNPRLCFQGVVASQQHSVSFW